jgi:hypothetical protein
MNNRSYHLALPLFALLLLFAVSCATTQSGKVVVHGTALAFGTELPVPDAKVTLAPLDLPTHTVATATTDRRGRFTFSVRRGAYTLWVSKEGYFEAQVNVSFDQPVNRVNVTMDQRNELHGFITEPDGSPAYPVVIELRNIATDEVFSGAALDDGSYRIENIPSGDYVIIARSPDAQFMRRGEKRISGGSAELNIQLQVNLEQSQPAVGDLPMKSVGEGGGEVVIK